MTKEELIQLLNDCIRSESEAIPLYTRHLESPDFCSCYLPGDRGRVLKALKSLADDARSHRGVFESLLAKVKETPDHAF